VERRSNTSDAENILHIQAGLFRCCSPFEDLGEIDLGTLALEQPATLRMVWDETRRRVRFQRDSEPVRTITYTQSVVSRPDHRVFQIRGDAANCETETGPQPFARMSADLDNIVINP
jgi:hypothetical protein